MTHDAVPPAAEDTKGFDRPKGTRRHGSAWGTTMAMAKRTFDREFKLQVIRQLLNGEKRLSQLCRAHHLSQTLVRR